MPGLLIDELTRHTVSYTEGADVGKLIYSMLTSLDGYVADRSGDFSWAQPDEEVLAAVNEWTAPIGTYLYGRRMYELMTVWENDPDLRASSPGSADFADIWMAADKVIYSSTLTSVTTSRTKLLSVFDPEGVRSLKRDSEQDLDISGPTLAAEAFRHGLVDEVRLIVCPVIIGGGLPAFPGVRADLRLIDTQSFTGGVAVAHYAVKGAE